MCISTRCDRRSPDLLRRSTPRKPPDVGRRLAPTRRDRLVGSVSEPCALVEKFPDIRVLYAHYTRGETLLESYWKSVAMPGQGLFIGSP